MGPCGEIRQWGEKCSPISVNLEVSPEKTVKLNQSQVEKQDVFVRLSRSNQETWFSEEHQNIRNTKVFIMYLERPEESSLSMLEVVEGCTALEDDSLAS